MTLQTTVSMLMPSEAVSVPTVAKMRAMQADKATMLRETKFKILMLGDSGVGKSSLVYRYASNEFSQSFLPTIGIDYKIKKLRVEDNLGSRVLRLAIWDSAGQERFRNITKQYFRGAHGMCIVFDVTNRKSFENVRDWLDQIDQTIECSETDTVIVLVGNKCDSPSAVVSDEEAQTLADSLGIRYFRTSAKANINVAEMFLTLALDMERRMLKRRASGEDLADQDASETIHLLPGSRSGNANWPTSNANCCSGGIAPVSPVLHPSVTNYKT